MKNRKERLELLKYVVEVLGFNFVEAMKYVNGDNPAKSGKESV